MFLLYSSSVPLVFLLCSSSVPLVFCGQPPFFKAEGDLKVDVRDRTEETSLGPPRLDRRLLTEPLHSVNKMNSGLEPLLNLSPDCGDKLASAVTLK